MRMAFSVTCTALTLTWAVSAVAAEPGAEARAKIARCIDKQGDEYIGARNWLIEHPEALDLLGGDSWKEKWLKKICWGWIEQTALYERLMRGFDLGEMHARRSVRVGVPDPYGMARSASRNYGDQLVPLMVECLWKTGRNWRGYKAWRMYAVVEYLKRHGDASILDPSIDVLVSQPSRQQELPDRGSEYPPMEPDIRAGAELADQMAPYEPLLLLVAFGGESALPALRRHTDRPETPVGSKGVLATTIKLLTRQLEAKKQGLPVEEIGVFDLCAELGDRTTLENMRAVWGEGRGFYGERARQAMANLEKRLEQEKQSEGVK